MGVSSPVIKKKSEICMLGILLEGLFWFADLLLAGVFVVFGVVCVIAVVSLGLMWVFCCYFLHNYAPILLSSVLPIFESLHSTAQGGHTFFN